MKKIILVFLLAGLISCAPKKDEAVEVVPITPAADGSQTMAQLAGYGGYCEQENSIVTNMATARYLTINANGTYVYDVRFSNNFGACAAPQATGGNEIGVYTQNGTIAIVGPAGISMTGTKVTFTPTTATLLLRSATYNQDVTNAIGNSLKTLPPGNCANGITFTNGQANTTFTVFGVACSSGATVGTVTANARTWPDGGTAFQNVIYNAGGVLQIGVSSSQDVLRPGGTTYPTSYSKTYLGW
ncbi:MAG: hypothetical protein H7Z71_10415 [Moraxellaceae bacterium]|nr:hypothetical protein [Pseudobdellovibrionaceae bacterium]